MTDFLKPANKLVVISDYVKLEDAHVRMGQAFPLIAEAEETYKIKFPKRNSDGTLYLKELTLAKTDLNSSSLSPCGDFIHTITLSFLKTK